MLAWVFLFRKWVVGRIGTYTHSSLLCADVCCHILVWDGGLQNTTSLDFQATGRVGFLSLRAYPSPTHLSCVRGMFVRVCVWVCERMCGVGEVCVGVREGVRGCEWRVWRQGSRDRAKSIHTHQPSQLHILSTATTFPVHCMWQA